MFFFWGGVVSGAILFVCFVMSSSFLIKDYTQMFCSRPFLIFFLSCVILGKFPNHSEPQVAHL